MSNDLSKGSIGNPYGLEEAQYLFDSWLWQGGFVRIDSCVLKYFRSSERPVGEDELPEFDDGCLEWENIDWDADKVGCDYNGSSSGSGSGSDSGSGSGSDACSDAINMICSCNTTGSYEHVLGGGVTLTLVDEVALFVFISWSCANIIDGVYNPTVTVNLKGVETINGMSYVEGSFNGSGTLSNNKVYYTITYQCEIGGVIHNRIIQRNIDV